VGRRDDGKVGLHDVEEVERLGLRFALGAVIIRGSREELLNCRGRRCAFHCSSDISAARIQFSSELFEQGLASLRVDSFKRPAC
jgi:hypothetical protein